MDLHVWVAYIATAVIFSLSPGSGAVNSISNGLTHGMKKSLISILGLQLGLTFHIIFVGAGIGALVAESAIAFSVIKWVGVAYLIWLGIQKWRDTSHVIVTHPESAYPSSVMLYKSLLVNLTNPKSIVFLVALFPQFIDPQAPHLPQLIILGVTTVTIDTLVMIFYTAMAARMGKWVRSDKAMRRLNKLFGSAFLGCGALLAVAKA
ncbi:Homoserine/homoserine lactone efflux protein [Vibrio aerogenes CECT 7868]|uniref:Homoserine/homoserine lactone efflux protein n=1 Tax=Vibrio aerogenes CECT 7868 TaxID=1216006 RepID=A0A1M6AKJ5_9VIBR|nr:homoserine/homoserine lactone efflux protein [Vibrio aerogenes]SHI36848.1 Homoserine/homoserine lactone efflux protein [Vibrio aerogenes CECT 7868]